MLWRLGATFAVLHLEGHAGQEDAIQEALQHGGEAEIPDGVAQHECLRPFQPLHVAGDIGLVDVEIVIVDAFLAREGRFEAFGVEIAIVDVMAGRLEGADDHLVQGCVEAGFHRMGIKDENAHVRSTSSRERGKARRPRNRSSDRPRRSSCPD